MFRRLLSTTTLAVMAGLLAGCTVLTDEDVPSQPPPLTPAAAPTVTASPTTTGAPLPEPTPTSTPAMPAPTTPQPIPASPATSPEGQLADEWRSLPDAPLALTEVAATAHRGEMWIAGGFDADGRPVASVLIFDPVTAAWREGPPLPEAVHHSALVSTGDGLFLLGGYVSSRFDSPTAAVRRLDAAGSGWVDADPLPEPRAAGAAAWDGSQLVYGGGVGPDGVSDAVFASDGGGWRDLARLMVAREHLGAASDGAGRVWFLGGRVRGLASNVGVVDLLAAGEVESLGELLTPRSGVAAFWLELTGPCLAGGEGPDGTFDDVECVSEDGSVRSLPRLGSARHGLGAAAFEDAVIVALGGPRPGLFVSAAVEELAISR